MGGTGPSILPDPAATRPGDHICLTYDGDDQFRTAVVGYFEAGIKANERLGFFAPQPKLAELTVWLTAAGVDIGGLAAAGQIVVGEVASAYLPGGEFNPDARIASFVESINEALADGFAGLRVVGDVATIMSDPGVRGGWTSYELRADLLAARMPFSAICSYDRRRCASDTFGPAASVHSMHLGEIPFLPGYRVTAHPQGGLSVAGEIDFASAPDVARLLVDAAGDAAPAIDVSGVTFIDAAGMRTVAAAASAAAQHHPRVEITGASRLFTRLWSLMGYARYDTIEVA